MNEQLGPLGPKFSIPSDNILEVMARMSNKDILTVSREQEGILLRTRTAFQQVTIARFPGFGKCLFLDGDLQSSEYDQEMYHAALIDPVFAYNLHIKTALILGGGEGATAKRILSHPEVERVTMVDIDEELVKICADLLPEWCGKVDDSRLITYYQDAGIFLPKDSNLYDLIVWDLVDPHRWDTQDPTAATNLYAPDFFYSIKEHLTENGLFSMEYADRNKKLVSNLLKNWRQIDKKNIYVPSFEEQWTFALVDKNRN